MVSLFNPQTSLFLLSVTCPCLFYTTQHLPRATFDERNTLFLSLETVEQYTFIIQLLISHWSKRVTLLSRSWSRAPKAKCGELNLCMTTKCMSHLPTPSSISFESAPIISAVFSYRKKQARFPDTWNQLTRVIKFRGYWPISPQSLAHLMKSLTFFSCWPKMHSFSVWCIHPKTANQSCTYPAIKPNMKNVSFLRNQAFHVVISIDPWDLGSVFTLNCRIILACVDN